MEPSVGTAQKTVGPPRPVARQNGRMSGAFDEPILHVDMDAFFVEVERLTDPSLVGRPVVVGGAGPRGVVAAASYEARSFGVHSALPMSQARRLCPHLVIVSPRHGRYGEVSVQVFEIFRRYTPLTEGLSVDEAFLDVSGLRLHYESSVAIGHEIRATIREELRLPASVGVAGNKFMAKLASGMAKPDGLLHVPVGTEAEVLAPLPVRALWGVGAATHASLEQLGVETIGDLAALPEATLRRRLGDAVGAHLWSLARGLDQRSVEPARESKSVSVEHTYDTDITGEAVVVAELLRHSERLGERLKRAGVSGRTVAIKVRYSDFTTLTRAETLPSPTNVGRDIYRAARRLVERIGVGDRPIRLLGVGVSGLGDTEGPRQLAVDRPAKWDELADAVHELRSRYGEDAVGPARLHESKTGLREVRRTADADTRPSSYNEQEPG